MNEKVVLIITEASHSDRKKTRLIDVVFTFMIQIIFIIFISVKEHIPSKT